VAKKWDPSENFELVVGWDVPGVRVGWVGWEVPGSRYL